MKRLISNNTASLMLSASLLGILILAALPIFLEYYPTWLIISYDIAALVSLIAHLFTHYEGKSSRVKRLVRTSSLAGLCFVVSGVMITLASYYPMQFNFKDWLAFLTAGAFLEIYTSLMIPYAEKKELNK